MFVIPSLSGGGAERVISHLLRNINYNIFKVYLVLLNNDGIFLKNLPRSIIIIELKKNRVLYSIFRLIFILKNIKPDIIFSTLNHMNQAVVIAQYFAHQIRRKIILRENTSTLNTFYNKSIMRSILAYSQKLTYKNKNVNYIICQSSSMANHLVVNHNIDNKHIKIIHNPIDHARITLEAKKDKIYPCSTNKIKLISVGRLEYVKGFDLLINIIHKLNDTKYHLLIIGDGFQKENLKLQVDRLKLNNSVSFLGFQDNPFSYMSQSDLMLVGSRYDSFPNTVLESLALGVPVISFDCPGGISEIIEPNKNGELVRVGDLDGFANTISQWKNSCYDKSDIINMAIEKYGIDRIINLYEKVFIKG
jgi:glycosyltransferase involved in cell wall biosynthesis